MSPPPIVNPISSGPDSWPESPVAMQREIRDLRQSMTLLWTLTVIFTGLTSLGALTRVPLFQRIFDDMIAGGVSKLPLLTQLVIRWAQQPTSYGLVFGLMVIALVMLWKASTARVITAWGALTTLILALHLGLVLTACFSPLFTVISSLQ